ncbi:MAG: ABC transporter ATP-binding protein [Candidatus Omnitrophota bacterium]|nr:MAG: ABC transporter ATP-binding protein [Candidatus Omnitrophota bacterium]
MIRLEDLYKRLGGKQILNGANLAIEEGETRVIIGRSGEGKSVLIKHICRLFQPDRGRVYIEGEEISQLSETELDSTRKKIGYLFQNAALFDSLNVLKNVGFALFEEKQFSEDEIREQVLDVLRLVRLGDILEKMPSELSGGMRKRVGLARAIIQKPKIILYDEPTTGLDPITSDAINDLIISLSQQLNVTSVVITHDMVSAFKIASKFSMLLEGRIIYTGSPDEVRTTDNEIIQQFIQGKSTGPLSNL